MDDQRLIPRLTPHGRLLLAPSDEGSELEPALAKRTDGWIDPARLITRRFPVSRTDEAYDLLDRRPEVMLTY